MLQCDRCKQTSEGHVMFILRQYNGMKICTECYSILHPPLPQITVAALITALQEAPQDALVELQGNDGTLKAADIILDTTDNTILIVDTDYDY